MTTEAGTAFRAGGPGRLGVLFAAIWLVFLVDPLTASWAARDRPAGWVGLAGTVGFALAYLWIWMRLRRQRAELTIRPSAGTAVLQLGLLIALGVVMCLAIGQPGTAAAVYVAVTGVMLLPLRFAAGLTVAIAGAVDVLGVTIRGWDRDLGLSFAVCAGAFAVFGVQQMMLRNIALMRAREENARLAVEDERNRFARDLHDILGHSLTVITVKAELAARLFDVDQDRARAELADLERLSRDALADVRRTVEGYRELTLPGELARARLALQAADIEADLPTAAEDVPTELRELFAWTVREGVTNVIRHSGARRCTVRLEADRVAVRDDGTGPSDGTRRGHGLNGLRERAAAIDALLVTQALEPNGFELAVSAR
jgi:two-component system sensor histidine kinase DesK